ncbi:MAG: helix-turn-helix transcriptional regulator [Halopseudomonas sp.]
MSDWPLLIRTYRKDNGLKQDVLAYMLNVDQTTISRWERGKDTPSIAIQKRLRDLFLTHEDSGLTAATRLVRFSLGRAALTIPGTKIIEVSDAYAERFKTERSTLKGGLMRHFLGDDFYEQFMVPVGDLGIYRGEVARVDYIAPVRLEDSSRSYSHSSVVPVFSSSGVYAVSQSQFVSEQYAQSRPATQVYRFDELID